VHVDYIPSFYIYVGKIKRISIGTVVDKCIHHPYWGILYHATEISKTILDEWDSNLTKDVISEMSWRADKIKVALEKIYEHNIHENS
jgi:hypothetical protein